MKSSIRMGWLLVMFDLPVMTEDQRRSATQFRQNLLADGYLMLQYSVYVRPCVTYEKVDKHTKRLDPMMPPGGNIRVIFLTDSQWMRAMTRISPDYRTRNLSPDPRMPQQLEFWE